MKRDDRQLKKNDKKLESHLVISLFMAIFPLLLIVAEEARRPTRRLSTLRAD